LSTLSILTIVSKNGWPRFKESSAMNYWESHRTPYAWNTYRRDVWHGHGRVFNTLGTAVLGLPSWSSNFANGYTRIRTWAVLEN